MKRLVLLYLGASACFIGGFQNCSPMAVQDSANSSTAKVGTTQYSSLNTPPVSSLTNSISVNGSDNVVIPAGATFTLAWTSSNASSCTNSTYSINDQVFAWPVAPNTAASYIGTFNGGTLSYSLVCNDSHGNSVSHSVTISDGLTNKYLSIALAYMNSVSSPIVVTLTTVRLKSDHTLDGIIYNEDARHDVAPLYSSVRENLMVINGAPTACVPQNLPLPGIFRFVQVANGTWSASGNTITISHQFGSVTLTQDGMSESAYLATYVPGYSTWRGYAYVSDSNPLAVPAPLTDAQIAASYTGVLDQNRPALDGTAFNSYPWTVNWFATNDLGSSSDVRSSTNFVNDNLSAYGYNVLARNLPGMYPNMIFNNFGHDFNNDHCANDGGHELVYFGIPVNGKIGKFLIIESSQTGSGTPAYIAVGRLNAN
ncbi:MAG: hypothetical protein AB7G93_01260 [Bdellovibrionales bacterium]